MDGSLTPFVLRKTREGTFQLLECSNFYGMPFDHAIVESRLKYPQDGD